MGIHNRKTQECLLRENNPSLGMCINIVRAAERARQHAAYISDGREKDLVQPMEIDKISSQKNTGKTKCRYCGTSHKFGRDSCPAYGKKCLEYGGSNHYATVCKIKSRNSRQIRNIVVPEKLSDKSEDIFELE